MGASSRICRSRNFSESSVSNKDPVFYSKLNDEAARRGICLLVDFRGRLVGFPGRAVERHAEFAVLLTTHTEGLKKWIRDLPFQKPMGSGI